MTFACYVTETLRRGWHSTLLQRFLTVSRTSRPCERCDALHCGESFTLIVPQLIVAFFIVCLFAAAFVLGSSVNPQSVDIAGHEVIENCLPNDIGFGVVCLMDRHDSYRNGGRGIECLLSC